MEVCKQYVCNFLKWMSHKTPLILQLFAYDLNDW